MPEKHLDRHRAASSTTDPAATGDVSTEGPVPAFGEKAPNRFAADVEYSGTTGSNDYLVRVRHRLLDTTFTVVIDGIEHDPKAEVKARPPEESAEEDSGAARDASEGTVADGDDGPAPEGSDAPETDESEAPVAHGGENSAADEDSPLELDESADAEPWADDDLRFTLKDGFATLLCTVRRPMDSGGYANSEEITIRTVGLGGAGEVEIRRGVKRIVLVPADGSPSAAREEKRTAHPTRYALVAAITKSARYLLPLLGFGALFSGVLDPLLEWIEARVRPAFEAIARMTEPVREWIAQLLRPVQEFLEAVFSPIREFFAMLLRPVRDLLAWLLGLLPDIGLPFDIPDWLPEVLVPVIVVVGVFSATRKGLHSRGEKLAAAKAAKAAKAAGGEEIEHPGQSGRAEDETDPSDPSAGPARSAPSPTADDDSRAGAAADVRAPEDEVQAGSLR
ncbi:MULTISPECIES: hypothetical protein [unclassified Brachybacterium]|uniref:hypothetical protein n=1 Tax=unclassified Brachybacterium TaxID=2623841 RepID=UPI003F944570